MAEKNGSYQSEALVHQIKAEPDYNDIIAKAKLDATVEMAKLLCKEVSRSKRKSLWEQMKEAKLKNNKK